MSDSHPQRPLVWDVGVDSGGTFTDCIAISSHGDVRRSKVLSTSALRARVIAADRADECLRLELSLPCTVDPQLLIGFSIKPIADRRGSSISGATQTLVNEARLSRSGDGTTDVEVRCGTVQGAGLSPPLAGSLVDLCAPWEAPILALRVALGRSSGVSLQDCRLRIGTTRGTNALLERQTTPVVLFTNAGIEDVLAIGDQRRTDIFAVAPSKPSHVQVNAIGVRVRHAPDGRETMPLDVAALRIQADRADHPSGAAAAIALLHGSVAQRNGVAAEAALANELRAIGWTWTSCASDVGASSRFEPRARAAVVDAALSGPVGRFVANITNQSQGADVRLMTSAGGIAPAAHFRPRESLLSGPAGGVVAAAALARKMGFSRVVTLDMGGTSADVARIDGHAALTDETRIGDVILGAPAVAVESVAAGGGSIVWWDGTALRVGPRSAGAFPGPASYGCGGPLTITDCNLLLGRVDPAVCTIPLDREAAQRAALALCTEVRSSGRNQDQKALLEQAVAIAEETMAGALRSVTVRQGINPAQHALLSFGGSGGLHACSLAERLGMDTVIIPFDAGILCAAGALTAPPTKILHRVLLRPLDAEGLEPVGAVIRRTCDEALGLLASTDPHGADGTVARCVLHLRLSGQEPTIALQVETAASEGLDARSIASDFRRSYCAVHGFDPQTNQAIEIESLLVEAVGRSTDLPLATVDARIMQPDAQGLIRLSGASVWVAQGWSSQAHPAGAIMLRRGDPCASQQAPAANLLSFGADEVPAARAIAIAMDMGETLRRIAVSPNIRDRLDFSCGILSAQGQLVVNAPHIPVHLGALGPCVRAVVAAMSLREGDVALVNHPRFGGSHLPDLTVMTPIHHRGQLVAFAANRAHHAEIGGTRPGSMPPDATCLAQEGVVIEPMRIVESGILKLDRITQVLREALHPSRMPADNIADLQAQIAANALAAARMGEFLDAYGSDAWVRVDALLAAASRHAAQRVIAALRSDVATAEERLDDGSQLCVRVERSPCRTRLHIDFTGSAAQHPRNLNAPLAVTRAVVMYTVRVLAGLQLGSDGPAFPMHEALLDAVDITVPSGSILNPAFSGSPDQCSACAIGQTETSQRLVDALWQALDIAACSQGTINNLLFGGAALGFYETIAGGAGATRTAHGASAVHTHISNTRLTDAEVLERRYPVQLERLRIRTGSGGDGLYRGGDGITRRLRFLEPVELSFLSQRRESSPRGSHGGLDGTRGAQRIIRANGTVEEVPGITAAHLARGDAFEVETPGGGGWGSPAPAKG